MSNWEIEVDNVESKQDKTQKLFTEHLYEDLQHNSISSLSIQGKTITIYYDNRSYEVEVVSMSQNTRRTGW